MVIFQKGEKERKLGDMLPSSFHLEKDLKWD
jgi:hypothetical protein